MIASRFDSSQRHACLPNPPEELQDEFFAGSHPATGISREMGAGRGGPPTGRQRGGAAAEGRSCGRDRGKGGGGEGVNASGVELFRAEAR